MYTDYSLHTALALWSFISGMFLCSVYDVFRVTRLRRKQNGIVLFICDIAFCAIAVCTMLLLFFNLSFGRMRAYAFVLTAAGFLTWRVTVSRLVIGSMLKLLNAFEKLLNLIKMRVANVCTRASRRIYTTVYCKTTLIKSKNGFGLIKSMQKGKETQNETEQTDKS